MPFEQYQHHVFMAFHVVNILPSGHYSSELIMMACFWLSVRSVLV